MIDFHDVRKSFGALAVLRGVRLEVRRGRILALVGPNAAGKTTLIKILLGLSQPDHGHILIDRIPLNRTGVYRARIGYMPQIASFPDNLTGTDLLDMLAAIRGSPKRVDDELLDAFALQPHLGKPLRALSGGTRQRLNAVIAFRFCPDILVLDEPTAGLDPVASSILKDRILRERDAGHTIIVTSHVMSELEEIADDVAFMLDGRVRFSGALGDLKQRTRQATLERAVAQLMMAGMEAAA